MHTKREWLHGANQSWFFGGEEKKEIQSNLSEFVGGHQQSS